MTHRANMIQENYPRVSKILEWYEENVLLVKRSIFHQEAREAKAKIGTQVHKAIEVYEKNGIYHPLCERGEFYFESYMAWRETTEPVYQCHEERYWDEDWQFTGQVDGIAIDKWNPYPYLIDFKTATKEGDLWPLQAHFYRKACGLPLGKMVFLRLHPKGRFPTSHTYNYDPEIEALCAQIAADYHAANELTSWLNLN